MQQQQRQFVFNMGEFFKKLISSDGLDFAKDWFVNYVKMEILRESTSDNNVMIAHTYLAVSNAINEKCGVKQ